MSSLRVAGATVLTEAGPVHGDVAVLDGHILSIGETADADGPELDANGCIVAPGFVDLQCNGGYGIDLTSEPQRIGELALLLPRHGVTAFAPTIVSSSAGTRSRAMTAIADHTEPAPLAAHVLGLHFEGPFLSARRAGAHDPAHLARPSDAELATWSSAAGVALVTLAPELDGALEVIERLVSQGVVVSAGHTDGMPAEFVAGRRAGITYVTHLFNAMRPFTHRDPGTVGAVLTDDSVVAGLICDGIHVDPVAVRLAWRVLGPDRLGLVTDSVAALGMPAGTHRLGRVDVVIGPDGVRTATGVLAGSALSMDQAVRNLVDFTGCDPVEALRTATATPARVLGRDDVGTLRPGGRADLVVLEQDLRVRATVVGGAVAWHA